MIRNGLRRSAARLAVPPAVACGAPGSGQAAAWPNVNGDSNETGFSSLSQITTANAKQLGLQWFLDLPRNAHRPGHLDDPRADHVAGEGLRAVLVDRILTPTH
jgi:hypothetical protein